MDINNIVNRRETAISNIVSGIVRIFKSENENHDAATIRAIRIMVQSMFNWSMVYDDGAVGFQIQQMVLMLMPDDRQEIVVHLFGQAIDLFRAEFDAYGVAVREDQEARRAALRAQLAARKAAQPAS